MRLFFVVVFFTRLGLFSIVLFLVIFDGFLTFWKNQEIPGRQIVDYFWEWVGKECEHVYLSGVKNNI